ncbi:MAG: histidinol-phosphatase HisJ family protein [Caldisericia bacterium]
MKLTDLHIHTNLSPDGKGDPQQHYNRAVELGLSVIAFTDHLDYETYNKDFDKKIIIKRINETLAQIQTGDKCKLIRGVELGYQEEFHETIDIELELLENLDFMIGSLHEIDGLGFSGSSSYKKYFDKHRRKSFGVYFDSLSGFAERGSFDVIGHFDIVKRFSILEGYNYKSSEYKNIICDILDVIIGRSKGIEINCSGLFQSPEDTFPDMKTVEWFFERGGEHLTIGSDSHKPEHISRGIKVVIERLQEMGINSVSIFENRKPKKYNLI